MKITIDGEVIEIDTNSDFSIIIKEKDFELKNKKFKKGGIFERIELPKNLMRRLSEPSEVNSTSKYYEDQHGKRMIILDLNYHDGQGDEPYGA